MAGLVIDSMLRNREKFSGTIGTGREESFLELILENMLPGLFSWQPIHSNYQTSFHA